MKNIHFISIKDEENLSLAMALKNIDYNITISDDYVSENLKDNLIENGLIIHDGWFPNKVTQNIDAIILGSNVEKQNSELIKAKSLGIKILSFSEFIYIFSENKTRIVVKGTRRKSSIILIIIHVLKYLDFSVDLIVNKEIGIFKSLISLSKENDFIIIEWTENKFYEPKSSIKNNFFNPHLALIAPFISDYQKFRPSHLSEKSQCSLFIESIFPGGIVLYDKSDYKTEDLVKRSKNSIRKESYSVPESIVLKGQIHLKTEYGNFPIRQKDKYELINIGAALWLCQLLGVDHFDFHEAIISY